MSEGLSRPCYAPRSIFKLLGASIDKKEGMSSGSQPPYVDIYKHYVAMASEVPKSMWYCKEGGSEDDDSEDDEIDQLQNHPRTHMASVKRIVPEFVISVIRIQIDNLASGEIRSRLKIYLVESSYIRVLR
ncbi:uncharacterized protein RCO7_14204 [Rhynchosporium graminicola]|uniref:Uncharacterized protein n=1 Tax=Rhynchosporium graminicola TaxID=2792576 RepID=A0A1E1JZZ5_9HELO|nr:uncharacterized protein RCO7_14204 [Rhynchosporium commune]